MKHFFVFVYLLFMSYTTYPQWAQTNMSNEISVWRLAVSGINLFASGAYHGDVTHQNIYRSTDGGTNWFAVNSGLPTDIYHSDLIVCGANLYLSSFSHGIFFSTDDGSNWTSLNFGLIDTNVTSLAVKSNVTGGTDIFVGTHQGIFYSKNNGIAWTKIMNCDTSDWSSSPSHLAIMSNESNAMNLFVGNNWYGGLLRLTENGTNWVVDTLITNISVHVMAVKENDLFVGTSGNGILHSTDSSLSWAQLNSGLTDINIRALAIVGANLFAGTWESGVFTSTNNGLSWTESNLGFPPIHGCVYGCPYVHDFAIIGSDTFAGTNNGVWRCSLLEMVPVEFTSFSASANGKEVTLSWSTATEVNNQGFEVQRKFGSNDFVTIGSIKGHGTTTSPNNYSYVDKLVDPGKYFYRLKQIDFGGTFEYSNEIEVEVRSVDKYTLEQNYPNPFNPTTRISWQSPVSSRQVLKVFDVLGNEVATLVNEEKEAGNYEIEFNAEKLSSGVSSRGGYASGVYFYQLRAGNFTDTKKMILLR